MADPEEEPFMKLVWSKKKNVNNVYIKIESVGQSPWDPSLDLLLTDG